MPLGGAGLTALGKITLFIDFNFIAYIHETVTDIDDAILAESQKVHTLKLDVCVYVCIY